MSEAVWRWLFRVAGHCKASDPNLALGLLRQMVKKA